MSIFRYGRPVTVATQGLLSNTPLTIGVQGILEPLRVAVDADLYFGGTANIYFDLQYAVNENDLLFNGESTFAYAIYGDVETNPDGDLIFNGTADAELVEIEFEYAATGGIIFNGEATTSLDFVYEYAATGGIIFNGAALDALVEPIFYETDGGIIFNGAIDSVFTEPVHDADGGVVFNGTADAELVEKERGGKGVPYRRRFHETAHIWYYAAGYEPNRTILLSDINRRRSDHLVSFGGDAVARFVPPTYLLIPTLPKVVKPLPAEPSDFLKLYFDLANPQLKPSFSYTSKSGKTKIGGSASVGYLDYGELIIAADDELMLMGMLDSLDPSVISTVFDEKMKRRRNDDDELIELGLL